MPKKKPKQKSLTKKQWVYRDWETDESSQTEKSDAENLQPQQDKLTPLSKPMGEGGEQGVSDVNEENTKVGDIVYHNGKAVKIVEFRDSRKGGREAIIELPQLTKDEIHKQAIDILRNRYKEFDNTDEDVISNHRGDYLNQISDISHSDSNASKRVNVNFDELSKSQTIETKDTEDWSRDVESTAKALEKVDEKELDKIPDWISKKEQETKEKNVVLKDGKK